MNLNKRSLLGGAVALLLVPFIAGLLACLPVPIGDPERSRVDIPLEGVWLDESFDAVWIIRVYDKRTWLVRTFGIVDNTSSPGNLGADPEAYDELVRFLRAEGIGKDGFSAGTVQAYKVWRTKIGGETFLTWQTAGGFDGDGLADPETWLVWRVVEAGDDRLELAMVNGDFSGFKQVEKTRRNYEKVIRKHVDDPELYYENTIRWVRVRDEDLKLFRTLADQVLAGPND